MFKLHSIIQSIKRSKVHLFVFIIGFFGASLIINFIQLILMITVKPFSLKLYRRLNQYPCYWIIACFYMTWWTNSEIIFHVHPEDVKFFGREHTTVVINHRYDLDWICAMIMCNYFYPTSRIQAIVKRTLRFVPVCWLLNFTDSIFVNRNFVEDQKVIAANLIKSFDDDEMRSLLLIYAEGTRFNKVKHEASKIYALEKKIVPFKHHLIPRTRGFKVCLPTLKQKCESLLNVQVAFDEKSNKGTLANMLKGEKLVCNIYIKRTPMAQVPSDEDGAGEFLMDMYREKDQLMENFLKLGNFGVDGVLKIRYINRYSLLINYLFWMGSTLSAMFYYQSALLANGDTIQFTLIATIMAALSILILIGVNSLKTKK